MRQYTIHIPVKYNNGELVSMSRIESIIRQALESFGGYSYDPTRILGGWKCPDTGKLYEEEMTRIVIATDNPSLLKTYAHNLAKQLDQECMYVVDNGNVSFIS